MKKHKWFIIGFVICLVALIGIPIAVVKATNCPPAAVFNIFHKNKPFSELARDFSRFIFAPQAWAGPCGGGGGGGGGGQPTDPCDRTNPTDQCNTHIPWRNGSGNIVHWPAATAAAGIDYYIRTGTPASRSTFIEASFDVWQSASNAKIKFIRKTDTTFVPNPLSMSDYINSVSFGTLSNLKEGWYQDPKGHWGYLFIQRDALTLEDTGATMAWNNTNGEIYEADTVLNSSLDWNESLPPDPNKWYIPNTMVHEAGHWLDLSDLCKYPNPDPGCGERELTMYYQTTKGETKYASLGKGDISGVQELYP